jgi:hypothetical protein
MCNGFLIRGVVILLQEEGGKRNAEKEEESETKRRAETEENPRSSLSLPFCLMLVFMLFHHFGEFISTYFFFGWIDLRF